VPARPPRYAVARLARDAACSDANPWIFDQTEGPHIYEALDYCKRCPVTALCRQVVKPSTSYYDGVAAGTVWRNGRSIASLLRPRSLDPQLF